MRLVFSEPLGSINPSAISLVLVPPAAGSGWRIVTFHAPFYPELGSLSLSLSPPLYPTCPRVFPYHFFLGHHLSLPTSFRTFSEQSFMMCSASCSSCLFRALVYAISDVWNAVVEVHCWRVKFCGRGMRESVPVTVIGRPTKGWVGHDFWDPLTWLFHSIISPSCQSHSHPLLPFLLFFSTSVNRLEICFGLFLSWII